MKNKILFVLFLVSLSLACTKEKTPQQDCIDNFLASNNMVAFEGEVMDCKLYVELYEYKNEQYFVLGSHCIDMVVSPVNCDGDFICPNPGQSPDWECSNFFNNAVNLGVVGIGN